MHLLSLPTLLSLLLPFSLAANITVYQPSIPYIHSPLPPPGPLSSSSLITTQFNNLGRTTVWTLVKKVHLEGDTGEPEGIVNIGESRFFVARGDWTTPTTSYAAGVIINGTNRTPGSGYAHINVYDGAGKRIADVTLTKPGDIEYHIGGIDYDGEKIWATLSQYRPNTTATVIAIDPTTLEYEEVLKYNDHLGGVVHDVEAKTLATLNWGSRNASLWNLGGGGGGWKGKASKSGYSKQPVKVLRNPSFYVDYQDCKFLGHPEIYSNRPVMICSGVNNLSANFSIGGLAIVDIETMVPLSEVPLMMKSDLGVPITQNPFDVAVVNGRMRVYFMPDQHNSTLYVYEAEPNSPFQFGGGPI